MRKALGVGLVIGLAVLASACSQRGPAEQAIAAAQTAFDAVKSDAMVYVPDQTKAVEDAFAAVKAAFDSENYTQVLADAQALVDKVNALKDASESKRKELGESWNKMSAALPPVVESIQARVDELSKMRRLPKEISKETFEAAKTGLDAITQAWSDATAAMEGGDLVGAVSKAESVKAKALEVINQLGMPAPDTM
jgi:hypothetical protein